MVWLGIDNLTINLLDSNAKFVYRAKTSYFAPTNVKHILLYFILDDIFLYFSNNILYFFIFRNYISMLSITDQVFLIPETNTNAISISGEGLKKLVIVTDAQTFGDTEKETLNKMMIAIKYSPDSDLIKVVLPAESNISLSNVVPSYNDLIIFGIAPERLGMHIDYKMNEIIHFDKSRLLVCDTIREMITVPQKKQILWTRLQEMFLK